MSARAWSTVCSTEQAMAFADIASRTIARWVQPLGHAAHHDVAIGDHADQPLVLEHGQAADS